MRKYIFLALLLTWTTPLFSAETVRVRTDIDLTVTGLTSGSIDLNADKPSGDGTAESAPAKVYLPVQNDGSANGGSASNLYFISPVTSVFNVSNTSHVAYLPLRISTPGGVDRYLWAAVKDTTASNAYKPIRMYGSGPLGQGLTNADITFPFSPADICTAVPSECTSLVSNSTSKTDKSFFVYFFLSSQSSYAAGSTVDVATAPLNNGIYYQTYLSNRVLRDSELRISITNLRNGDGRVVFDYSATATINLPKSVRVYLHDGAPGAQNSPLASYSGSVLTEVYPYAQSSELTVTNLTNGSSPRLSVFFLDKYNFATTLSGDVVGVPQKIEELLKKEGCFLLTAGFGEEHYVIEYFRQFRDNVLSKNVLGRMFISTYYELAPKYALAIYKSETIRALVRGAAYILYFLFNYISTILIISIVCSFLIYLIKKREKIEI